MKNILNEIKYDVDFLRGHTLQPKWFKVFKIFILLSAIIGYLYFFGWLATILFVSTFITLMLGVHFIYRKKTNRYTTSWLDFVVNEESATTKPKRIGKYYYPAIALNAIISIIVSQVLS